MIVLVCALLLAVVSHGTGSESAAEPGELDDWGAELESSPDDVDAQEMSDALLRELAALRRNPVDINSAGLAALLRLPLLDPAAAGRIVDLRGVVGFFETVDELVQLGAIEPATLRQLRAYIVARPTDLPGGGAAGDTASEPGASRMSAEADPGDDTHGLPAVSWALRARTRSDFGSDQSGATGSPADALQSYVERTGTYLRFRLERGERLGLGVTCERDAGEKSLADHVAFCITWRAGGEASRSDRDASRSTRAASREVSDARGLSVTLGDLTGVWAQGLVLGGGGFSSTRGYPITRDRLKGYDGSGEASARRGACVVASRGRVIGCLVVARTMLDATLDEQGLVRSIRTSGIHRSESELVGSGVLAERLYAGRVSVRIASGTTLGAGLVDLAYDPPFVPGDPDRERFGFHGRFLKVAGADLRVVGDGTAAAAEAALGSNGGSAWLICARMTRGSARFRCGAGHVSRDFWNPLGRAVPGSSAGSNATVGWIGTEYKTRRGARVWAELEVRGRPWRTYLLELPDRCVRVELGTELRLTKSSRLRLETDRKEKLEEDGDEAPTVPHTYVRTKVTLEAEGAADAKLAICRSGTLRDAVRDGEITTLGLALRRELSDVWSLAVGATAVATRGPARIVYQYEPRLPGEFGLQSLNRAGTRWYVLAQRTVFGGAGLSIRLGGGPQRGSFGFGIGIDVRGPGSKTAAGRG